MLHVHCYCEPADEGDLACLRIRLAPLERQGLIRVSSPRTIIAGAEFEREMDALVQQADLLVLLLSADFLASTRTEALVQRARSLPRRPHMVPILVRPCELGPLEELLPLPRDGKALSLWQDRDEGWQQVYQGLRDAIHAVLQRMAAQVVSTGDRPDHRPGLPDRPAGTSPGRTSPVERARFPWPLGLLPLVAAGLAVLLYLGALHRSAPTTPSKGESTGTPAQEPPLAGALRYTDLDGRLLADLVARSGGLLDFLKRSCKVEDPARGSPESCLLLGILHDDLGHPKEACKHLEKANSLDPRYKALLQERMTRGVSPLPCDPGVAATVLAGQCDREEDVLACYQYGYTLDKKTDWAGAAEQYEKACAFALDGRACDKKAQDYHSLCLEYGARACHRMGQLRTVAPDGGTNSHALEEGLDKACRLKKDFSIGGNRLCGAGG